MTRSSHVIDALCSEKLSPASTHTCKKDEILTKGTLAEIEKQVIVERLLKCNGNKRETADELGIAKSTLHEKLRRWKNNSTNSNWFVFSSVNNRNRMSTAT